MQKKTPPVITEDILEEINDNEISKRFIEHETWAKKCLKRELRPTAESLRARMLKIRDDYRLACITYFSQKYRANPNDSSIIDILWKLSDDLSDRYEGKPSMKSQELPEEDKLGGVVILPEIKEIKVVKRKNKKDSLETP